MGVRFIKGVSKEAPKSQQNQLVENVSNEDQAEIDQLRSSTNLTRRPTAPALEEILYQAIPVLDRGFVRVVDYFGDDAAIVQAARVSYGKGTKKISDDRNLIRYLMRHRHSTPFEMCEIKLHVKLPIFVARQWIRHRTANVNEYSARYSVLDKEFYVPDASFLDARRQEEKAERKIQKQSKIGQADMFGVSPSAPKPAELAPQSKTNRQGRDNSLGETEAVDACRAINAESARAYTTYMKLLNDDGKGGALDNSRLGIARELARMVLPTNYYTQWYWKIDLNNLFHFISLRADSHAQHEIRVYAEKLCDIAKRWVPIAWEAFEDYRMKGASISGPGMKVIRRMLAGEDISQESSGLSKREWAELLAAIEYDSAVERS